MVLNSTRSILLNRIIPCKLKFSNSSCRQPTFWVTSFKSGDQLLSLVNNIHDFLVYNFSKLFWCTESHARYKRFRYNGVYSRQLIIKKCKEIYCFLWQSVMLVIAQMRIVREIVSSDHIQSGARSGNIHKTSHIRLFALKLFCSLQYNVSIATLSPQLSMCPDQILSTSKTVGGKSKFILRKLCSIFKRDKSKYRFIQYIHAVDMELITMKPLWFVS